MAGNTTNLSCVIAGLSNGVTYFFAVTAIQGGVEGTPSEQVPINPFDITQNVLCAGSMSEGGQFTPVVELSSTAVSLGQPSYIGALHLTGLLDLRELDYYGYGNLQNETVGTEGYVLFDWEGEGTRLTNLLAPITITPAPAGGRFPIWSGNMPWMAFKAPMTDGSPTRPARSQSTRATPTIIS